MVVRNMEEESQALVFVSTRRFTESLANHIAGKIKRKIPSEKKKVFKEVADKILDVPKRRGTLPTAVCLKLAECVESGVAFHHEFFNKLKDCGLIKPTRMVENTQFYSADMESSTMQGHR